MSFHLPIYADAMAYASITDLATRDEGFIGSCSSSSRSSSISSGISLNQSGGLEVYSYMFKFCSDDTISLFIQVFVFVLLARLVAFLFLFQFAMKLPGPLRLIYMMVSSSGLNHIVLKHFVWCKSFTSFHSFTLHLFIPLHGWI
jgi:hypothetical protein